MKLHVDRDLLAEHLGNIAPITSKVPSTDGQNILRCALLAAGEDGLHVYGSDTAVAYGGHLEAKVSRFGMIAVPADKLLRIVKSMPEPVVTVAVLKNCKVELTSGQAKLTVNGLDGAEYPAAAKIEEGCKRLTIGEAVLRRVVEQTAYAVCDNDLRYGLNGLRLRERGGRLEALSTDGIRAAFASAVFVGEFGMPKNALVSRTALAALRKILDGDCDSSVDLEFGETAIRVVRKDRHFWFRLIEGEPPDLDAIVPTAFKHSAVVDRRAMLSALERGRLLGREQTLIGRFTIGGDRVVLEASADGETMHETVEATTTGEELLIGLSLKYTADTLSVLRTDQARLRFVGPLSQVLVDEGDESEVSAVVMPSRLV